ncbi:MAG: helix-turn-helix domain-containing protein, partial [Bacteroidetes bacterium]|nr:helix-turn-helix domain-containing protein [Bacteroidota bacterium]
LLDDSKLLNQMTLTLARRIYNKTVTARELIHNTPEDKILAFLKSTKKNMNANEKNFVNHTRQEIANLTGLRVETVIRTLKKMETEKLVCIINRKLYF